MDYNQFMKFMDAGNDPGRESVNVLQDFVKEFPYFQSAHILLAKTMHDNQHVRYEKQLKVASVYAGDRNVLYDLINIKAEKEKTVRDANSDSVFAPVQTAELTEKENIPAEKIIETVQATVTRNEYQPPVVPFSQPQHIIFEEDENTEEPPIDFDEPPVADPHDIIRKRLVEILGLASEAKDSVADYKASFIPSTTLRDQPSTTDKDQHLVSSKDQHLVSIGVPSTSDKEEPPTTVSGQSIAKEKSIQEPAEKISEIPEQNRDDNKDVIEKLAEESTRAVDFIQTAEIEYALENSIIQSLEKLPVIDDPKKTEIIEPPEVKTVESHSFFDWLKFKPILGYGYVEEVHAYDDELENEVLAPETEKQGQNSEKINELIDRFIETDPRIIPSKTEFYSPSTQAKRSITENEDVVSETLARIYFQQGNLLKARSAYEKLSLFYPEKLAYFAALISEIDRALSNQDK